MAIQDLSGRAAAKARRDAQVCGKAALPAKVSASAAARVRVRPVVEKAPSVAAKPAAIASLNPVAVVRRTTKLVNKGRDASQARRQAMSSRGKAGVGSADRQRAQDDVARERDKAQAKDCGCGCNGSGDCDEKKTSFEASSPVAAKVTAKRRGEVKEISPSNAGRMKSQIRRQALATHGKNGVDVYRSGISSVQMMRQQNPEISGRELARSIRTQRSQAGGSGSKVRAVPAGRRRPSRTDDDVSGTKVSHSDKTTGDEMGLCRDVTGTEYFSSEVFTEFCQNEAPKLPQKVVTSESLSGGKITTASQVGRSDNVTGNEQGSCRTVTGCEYVGREEYDDFCKTKPEPGVAKVSFSQTTRGQIVSGSKPARSEQVTGDEAGTCSAVTGTPYTGAEQFGKFCKPGEIKLSSARNQERANNNVGRDITGIQPGFSGLTGAGKGVCSDVSGTAYVGDIEQQDVCGAAPAQVGELDFPQPLTGAPWGAFSVVPPIHASQQVEVPESVTGTRYENGRVSGTFSMGEGKITGTEQFRFGDRKARDEAVPVASKKVDAPNVSRVTGEGLTAGLKITGNDWGRGDHVTGTEGTSAMKRNPTRRGPMSAMPSVAAEHKAEVVERNDINVTGGSGSSDSGALVTLSGGARG